MANRPHRRSPRGEHKELNDYIIFLVGPGIVAIILSTTGVI